jgi:hypothetical protein
MSNYLNVETDPGLGTWIRILFQNMAKDLEMCTLVNIGIFQTRKQNKFFMF